MQIQLAEGEGFKPSMGGTSTHTDPKSVPLSHSGNPRQPHKQWRLQKGCEIKGSGDPAR